MDESLNKHYKQLLGLDKAWRITNVKLDIQKERLTINVHSTKGTKLPCPICNKLCTKEDSRKERKWRHLDTMQFETIIKCRIPRVRCPKHNVKTVNIPWANPHSRFTLLFERFAIDVLKGSKSITSATEILGVSWEQAFRIQTMAVERGMKRREQEEIKHLGVDEKSFLKGHSYASILNDLSNVRVLDVVEKRTEESAIKLMQGLPEEQRESIEAIAMDMWKPFMNAAETVYPMAKIVHDKYHVAGYLGKAVDSVRKSENRLLVSADNNTLKGTKYLWLTSPENMNKDKKKEFRSIMKTELKVGKAWAIKESFRLFWNYRYIKSAIKFFNRWYFWATHSKLKPVIKAAKTLKRHFEGILAYLKHRITNAVSEGLNSKIQSIKAGARGFRNFQNYRVSILFHCGKLDLYP